MKKTLLLLFFVCLMALFITGCASRDRISEPTSVGLIAPFTGDAASYGQHFLAGVKLAVLQFNSSVQLITEDTGCDATKAATATKKLLDIDTVDVILGDVCSAATLAAASVARNSGTIIISPASSAQELTNYPLVFRTIPTDEYHAKYMSDLIFEDGNEKVAIIYSNEPYGVGYEQNFLKHFKGNVVLSLGVSRDAVSFQSELVKIRNVKPDAILIATNNPASAIVLLKQVDDFKIDAAQYGAETLQDKTIIEEAGLAANGLVISSLTSGTKEFKEMYESVYGEKPGLLAAQGYDAMYAYLLAKNGSNISQNTLQQSLQELVFTGATGVVDFDENGDLVGAENEVWIVLNETLELR